MSELMSFVVLFTGQTAEQYVIAGVTILSYWYFLVDVRTDVVCCIVYWTNSWTVCYWWSLTYCSAACPVNNTTNDISSDIDLKTQITEISDSSINIMFTEQTAEQYVIDGVTILSYWYFLVRTNVVCCIAYWTNSWTLY
jgi:hypothetical protein